MTPLSTSSDDRWTRIEELFHQTAELDAVEAAAILDRECDGDPELLREVESLLESARHSGGFLDSLAEQVFSSDKTGVPRTKAALREVFDPMVGKRVGHYEVGPPLEGGGMSHVYEGFDTRLQRRVALKFLPAIDPESEAYKRFFVEGRATAALEHVNICAIHDIGEIDDGRPYLVMTFYEGESLRERLQGGPLELSTALYYGVQACRGLGQAHDAEIIHRDVKPGNLFITRDDTLKVLDFGLAKLADSTLTGTGRAMGTLSYMSPEQATGERVDARTDIWSLGVVLYEMLTGVRPFDGKTPGAVVEAIVRTEPVPLRELDPVIPAAVERTVLAALEKDRDRRTPTVRELEQQLAGCRPARGPTGGV